MRIQDFSIFNNIDTDKIKYYKKQYYKKAMINFVGDICECIHLIVNGKMVAYAVNENGSETVVFEFGKGDIIGSNIIFAMENRFPLNIMCVEETEVFVVNKNDLHTLFNDLTFCKNFIYFLSNTSSNMNKKIAMHSQKTLRENLLNYLSFQSKIQSSSKIKLPMSKNKLAHYLGVQRQSLFREFKLLKDENIIAVDKNYITLF